MSDQGEKTCPLCAEEMDLTDQQLKPCKCGYEICVWCWNHIMDMAEKDETGGRCPACRTLYNKEKVVGTSASCERLVSEMNVEKKLKTHKGKSKSFEGRKQLAGVRVIQKNLVYVVGLPLSFADENLLQLREYFGQYGNVLKVSISRTAAGTVQHFANSTCSVYITFSKEEEAVRCIQSVHGFVLDSNSRPLRACFGTTKYCHAWLRNVPCSNPDCLYLHESGSQEDSFSKDEIISAYTRSRLQQITGSSNSTQRRSGNVLPAPADENIINSSPSSGKPISKTAVNTNNTVNKNGRVSPPKSTAGRSAALPAGASWGSRASSNQPLRTSAPASNEPLKQKPDVVSRPVACSSPRQLSSLHSDTGKTVFISEERISSQDKSITEALEPVKKEPKTDSSSATVHSATSRKPSSTKLPVDSSNTFDTSLKSSGLVSNKNSVDSTNRNMENVCSNILSMSINENQNLENSYVHHNEGAATSQLSGAGTKIVDDVGSTDVQSNVRLGMEIQVPPQVDLRKLEEDLSSFENRRFKDAEVSINITPDRLLNHSNLHSTEYMKHDSSVPVDLTREIVDRNSNLIVSASNIGHPGNISKNNVEYLNIFPSKEKKSPIGRYEREVAGGVVDMGESSIISNILSIDFDPWDESLTSSKNLAELLGETDKYQGYFGAPGPRKTQNNNQSRFSFAREEDHTNHLSDFGQSVDHFEMGNMQCPVGNYLSNGNTFHFDKFASRSINGMEPETLAGNHSFISPDKLIVPRSPMPAPPGFSVPSRLPPPGFTSHYRTDPISDRFSGHNTLDASSRLLTNNYQAASSDVNAISNIDIEFIDPAILAVGKGTIPSHINSSGVDFRTSYFPRFSTHEDATYQSFLQRSLPPHQNPKFINPGDSYSQFGDSYGFPARVSEQTVANNVSQYTQFGLPQYRNGVTSYGQWDGWNEVHGRNNLGMSELVRNERLGLDNFYSGHEEPMIRLPSSGNLYNGTYRI